ncbi:hypothetical protein OIU79_001003 [Salix purpurea]|uniref:Uncharacterized protein n=1 Tax=Salix purpurea TaxID=77065 RepID=A0A9Q0V4K9_SALPP|nr:hypothetical protein OIU79_001003 [Salix purpurea]
MRPSAFIFLLLSLVFSHNIFHQPSVFVNGDMQIDPRNLQEHQVLRPLCLVSQTLMPPAQKQTPKVLSSSWSVSGWRMPPPRHLICHLSCSAPPQMILS